MALLETTIETGKIRGIVSGVQTVSVYRGIPFAKPPVGSLRWKAPEPAQGWDDVRECCDFGPMPYQGFTSNDPPERAIINIDRQRFGLSMSEDCLYLNVWTPAESTDDMLPVVVWYFGGGYATGRGHEAFVDGDMYCKRGVVFVSVNYRVNIFGFLCHPDLAAEDPHGSSGNYGVMDQIAALKWVKRNIRAFGGDPDNIGIMGLSAGSRTVQNLCLSPLTQGDIKHAINMSGAGVGSWQSLMKWDLEAAGAVGEQFFVKAGIQSVEQARALTSEEIYAEFVRQRPDYVGWKVMRPCIDGYILKEQMIELYHQGAYADIDYMIGVTADENDGFYRNPDPDNIPAFVKMMEENYGPKAGEMLEVYGLKDQERLRENILRFRTDDLRAAALSWCELLSRQGKKPHYMYYFDHVPEGNPPGVGAYHSLDEIYCLDSLHRSLRRYHGEDYDIAARMADYFTNFLKTGNPNREGLPEWESYRQGEYNAMTFANGGGMKQVPLNDVVRYKMKTSLREA